MTTTHTPTLIRPKNGTRNQKNVSCEPRSRSFFVKSIGLSVEFVRQWNGSSLEGNAVDVANEEAKSDMATSKIGRDERTELSRPSMKVMK